MKTPHDPFKTIKTVKRLTKPPRTFKGVVRTFKRKSLLRPLRRNLPRLLDRSAATSVPLAGSAKKLVIGMVTRIYVPQKSEKKRPGTSNSASSRAMSSSARRIHGIA
jgi:hypothetical protein